MSMDSQELQVYYTKFINDTSIFHGDKLKNLKAVDWNDWINGSGLAKQYLENKGSGMIFDFMTPEAQKAFDLADEYIDLAGEHSPFNL